MHARDKIRGEVRVARLLHLLQQSNSPIHLPGLGAHVHAAVIVDQIGRQPVTPSVVQLGLLHMIMITRGDEVVTR